MEQNAEHDRNKLGGVSSSATPVPLEEANRPLVAARNLSGNDSVRKYAYASKEQEAQLKSSRAWTKEDAKWVFNRIDLDKNGYLSKSEVADALGALQVSYSAEDLDELFQKMQEGHETPYQDRVYFDQFALFVLRRQEELKRVFCQIDVNKNGYIEVEDVMHGLKQLGLKADEYSAHKLLHLFAKDKSDKKVDFEEFRSMAVLLPFLHVDSFFENWNVAGRLDMGESSYNIPTQTIDLVVAIKILLAGGIAGTVSRTATAPFDRLKVLLQVQGQDSAASANLRVTGIRQGLQAIYAEGGWRGYFRGNGANVVKIFPESALRFFAFEFFKPIVSEDPENIRISEKFVAGALAGVVSQTSIYPLEMAKTRLAVSKEYTGILQCLRATASEGPHLIFRGLTPSLVGIIPYAGVDLAVYSTLKEHWRRRHPAETPSALMLLTCGAISSFCGQVMAYPLQLVRTRLQAQGTPGRPMMYTGMIHCFQEVIKKNGVRGLYKGITPNFMKAIPAVSISYVVYEKCKRTLGIDIET